MSEPPAVERRVKTTTLAQQQLAELRAFHTRVVHSTSTDARAWRALAGPGLQELTDEQLRHEASWAWLRAWATEDVDVEGDEGDDRRARLRETLSAPPKWFEHLAAQPAGDEHRDYRHERLAAGESWFALLRRSEAL